MWYMELELEELRRHKDSKSSCREDLLVHGGLKDRVIADHALYGQWNLRSA